jgi:hypothetical protein
MGLEGGVYRSFWWENLKERDHWRDMYMGEVHTKTDLREIGWGVVVLLAKLLE